MFRAARIICLLATSFPHASGDVPRRRRRWWRHTQLSPREWGCSETPRSLARTGQLSPREWDRRYFLLPRLCSRSLLRCRDFCFCYNAGDGNDRWTECRKVQKGCGMSVLFGAEKNQHGKSGECGIIGLPLQPGHDGGCGKAEQNDENRWIVWALAQPTEPSPWFCWRGAG